MVSSIFLQVTGDVSKTSGELGFLRLVWKLPSDAQTGSYECKVTGITDSGQISSFRRLTKQTIIKGYLNG